MDHVNEKMKLVDKEDPYETMQQVKVMKAANSKVGSVHDTNAVHSRRACCLGKEKESVSHISRPSKNSKAFLERRHPSVAKKSHSPSTVAAPMIKRRQVSKPDSVTLKPIDSRKSTINSKSKITSNSGTRNVMPGI